MPRVTAVVVTHNRPALLRQVLTALVEQDGGLERILVVDNASDPETVELLRRTSHVEVVRSSVNLGGAGGFELGVQHALRGATDWIWLMDDDAVPAKDALQALRHALSHAQAKVGALCCAVREYGGIALMHRRRYHPLFGIEKPLAEKCYAGDPVPIDTGSFVGFLVRASAARRIGPPDARYFLAYDDTDYSLRLRQQGFEILLVPSSVIEHHRTAAARLRGSTFGVKHYFNIRNRIVLKARFSGFPRCAALGASVTGIALWLMCRGPTQKGSTTILLKAIRDGWQKRLGVYPPT